MPRKLKLELPGHDVRTVTEMRWSGIKNGPLLHRAAQDFDAFLTVDQGFEYLQNLSAQGLMIVLMIAKSNDIDDLRPLTPQVRNALEKRSPGDFVRVQI